MKNQQQNNTEKNNTESHEILLAVMGILLAAGAIKANELEQFASGFDFYALQSTPSGPIINIYFHELSAWFCFMVGYWAFLLLIGLAGYKFLTKPSSSHPRSILEPIGWALILLVAFQTFSIAAVALHYEHKYEDFLTSHPGVPTHFVIYGTQKK